MTANRCIQIAAAAVGAVWLVLAGPAAASEGGADNDEVYTFAFFHYAVAGVRVRF